MSDLVKEIEEAREWVAGLLDENDESLSMNFPDGAQVIDRALERALDQLRWRSVEEMNEEQTENLCWLLCRHIQGDLRLYRYIDWRKIKGQRPFKNFLSEEGIFEYQVFPRDFPLPESPK